MQKILTKFKNPPSFYVFAIKRTLSEDLIYLSSSVCSHYHSTLYDEEGYRGIISLVPDLKSVKFLLDFERIISFSEFYIFEIPFDPGATKKIYTSDLIEYKIILDPTEEKIKHALGQQ